MLNEYMHNYIYFITKYYTCILLYFCRNLKKLARAVTPIGVRGETLELHRLGVGNMNTKFDGRYLHANRGNDMFRRDMFNPPVIDNKAGPQVSTINVAPWGNIDKENDSGNI